MSYGVRKCVVSLDYVMEFNPLCLLFIADLSEIESCYFIDFV